MAGEFGRHIAERVIAGTLAATAVGVAACGTQVAGQAEAVPPTTVHQSVVPTTTAPRLSLGPITTSERLTNMPGEPGFSFVLNGYGGETAVVTARQDYDYAPTVIEAKNGDLDEWFCGGGGNKDKNPGERGDSIWESSNNQDGMTSAWTKPVEVIGAAGQNSLANTHACDPDVVAYDGNYYIAYSGATNWTPYGGRCKNAPAASCDNNIFLARVPETEVDNPAAYQILAQAGSPGGPANPQYVPAGPNVLPIPIIRPEHRPVWEMGAAESGGTSGQVTEAYGFGQPSMVINRQGELVIFYTDETDTETQENVAIRPVADLANPTAMADGNFSRNDAANIGNEVDYVVAYDAPLNRDIAAIAEEHPQAPKSRLGAPRIAPAVQIGGTTTTTPAPIISNVLGNPAYFRTIGTETDTHNVGFLTDGNGWLVEMPGHPGGPSYDWLYDSTNAGDPAHFDIHRIPFTITPSP